MPLIVPKDRAEQKMGIHQLCQNNNNFQAVIIQRTRENLHY